MQTDTAVNASNPAAADSPEPSDLDILLEAFLEHKGSLFAFARDIGYTISQLLAWWNHEDTQSAVKALEALAEARTKLIARLHAPAAIETASMVSKDPAVKPPERRRAAALILRHAAGRLPRPSGRNNPAAAPTLAEAAQPAEALSLEALIGSAGYDLRPPDSPSVSSTSASNSARKRENGILSPPSACCSNG